jgi:hypothetical protein
VIREELKLTGTKFGCGREFAGDAMQGWRAYNITSDKRFGIGAWSDAQLASFLSSAHAQDRGSAAGPMAEAVENGAI